MSGENQEKWEEMKDILKCVSGGSIVVTTALTAILFAFNWGRSIIFNIPAFEWSLSIQQFLPLFVALLVLCALVIIFAAIWEKNKAKVVLFFLSLCIAFSVGLFFSLKNKFTFQNMKILRTGTGYGLFVLR